MKTCLLLIFCILIINKSQTCNPGGGTRRLKWMNGKRLPNVNENSIDASREGTQISPNDKTLGRIIDTGIIFKDSSYDSEARLAIQPCRKSLVMLAEMTKTYWNGELSLLVTEGYVNAKTGQSKAVHRKDSLHFSGRAFDIEIVKLVNSTTTRYKQFNSPTSLLRTLAQFAYYNARFTFVELKKKHIHVSCRKSADIPIGRCFNGDSFVRKDDGKMLRIKNVRVGDKVLTINSKGSPVYSEVSMIMHQDKDQIVDDYVQITTSHGKTITLSAYHLIFISKTHSIFAKDVKSGQNVFTYDVKSNKLITSTVTNTSIVSKVGVYAPLTMEGTIIVDDVYASCYALFPSHPISHAVFWVWRTLYPYLKHSETFMKSNTEYHWYADIFRTSINNFNIFPYVI